MGKFHIKVIQGETTIEAEDEEEALEKLKELYRTKPGSVDYSAQKGLEECVEVEKVDD